MMSVMTSTRMYTALLVASHVDYRLVLFTVSYSKVLYVVTDIEFVVYHSYYTFAEGLL